MKHGIVGSGLALLGGSAVGAALMYLLDPQEGEHRRNDLAAQGSSAVHSAGSKLNSAWQELADYAHQVTEHVTDHAAHVADKAQELGSSASDTASDAGHHFLHHATRLRKIIAAKARDYANAAQDQVSSVKDSASKAASDYGDQAKDYATSAHHRVRSMLGQEPEESHAAAYTLTGIGALALGLGALYLFDTEQGAERRQSLLDHAQQYLGDTGTAFRSTGAYLARQYESVVKEVRHLTGASDEVSNPGGSYGAPEGGQPQTGQQSGQQGGGEGAAFHLPHLTSGSRLALGLAGGSLGFYGAVRRDWVGMGAGLLGVGMIATGLAGVDYHAWSERARQYSSQLADQAKQYGSTLSDHAGDLRQKAQDYGQQLSEKAGQWSQQARDLASQGVQKAQDYAQQATSYVQHNTGSDSNASNAGSESQTEGSVQPS